MIPWAHEISTPSSGHFCCTRCGWVFDLLEDNLFAIHWPSRRQSVRHSFTFSETICSLPWHSLRQSVRHSFTFSETICSSYLHLLWDNLFVIASPSLRQSVRYLDILWDNLFVIPWHSLRQSVRHVIPWAPEISTPSPVHNLLLYMMGLSCCPSLRGRDMGNLNAGWVVVLLWEVVTWEISTPSPLHYCCTCWGWVVVLLWEVVTWEISTPSPLHYCCTCWGWVVVLLWEVITIQGKSQRQALYIIAVHVGVELLSFSKAIYSPCAVVVSGKENTSQHQVPVLE
jgi:hypothetical protein